MSATTDLTDRLIAVLDASPLGRDEKVKALGMARSHINHIANNAEDWRAQRAAHGPVGTGKHTDAIKDAMKEIKSPAGKKGKAR